MIGRDYLRSTSDNDADTAPVSTAAEWRMPPSWRTALSRSLGSTHCNLHKALPVTDVGAGDRRWRQRANGCDERAQSYTERVGQAASIDQTSLGQISPATAQWTRVDNLTRPLTPRQRPANDMISFWIYISVFIDDVRLFGRGKQTCSPSYSQPYTTAAAAGDMISIWRHCLTSHMSFYAIQPAQVSPSPTNLLDSSSAVGRSPVPYPTRPIFTVTPRHRRPADGKCPSRDHVT